MASRRYRARNSLNGTVTSNNARINTVEKRSIPTRIANGAIDGALLANNSVTAQTLAPASVQTENIAAGAITTGLIADASITSTKLAEDALANVPVGVDSVYTAAIQDLAVTNAKLAGSISGDKLSSLDASKIGSGTFDVSRIPDLAASKVTSGIFNADRIPTLDITTKTSGNLPLTRVSSPSIVFGTNYIAVNDPTARLGNLTSGNGWGAEGDRAEFDVVSTGSIVPSPGASGMTISAGSTGSISGFSISAGGNGLSSNGGLTVSGGTSNLQSGLTVSGGVANLNGGTFTSYVDISTLRLSQDQGSGRLLANTGILCSGNLGVTGNFTYVAPVSTGTTRPLYWNSSSNLVYVLSSSARYKTDIQDAEFDYEKLLQVSVRTFKNKQEVEENGAEAAETTYGYIAEELHDLGLTQFVIYENDENGTPRAESVNYMSMALASHAMLKVQDGLIKNLTARIEALENRA